jgi:proteasome lid subunit RPN8/RPN11
VFGSDIENAAIEHARKVSPEESCGVVAGGKYHPCKNTHKDPMNHFTLSQSDWLRISKKWPIEAVIHSHTGIHSQYPSAHDMEQQQIHQLPWGIVNPKGRGSVLWFGDHVLNEPLVGRKFIPGVKDCYAIIRAYYWQERKIKLREFPRDEEWWMNGGRLFVEGFKKAGFMQIGRNDLREGDVMLMQIRSKTPNHGAVILDNGLMLHHVHGQLSRREPFGRWLPYATHCLRYKNA